LIGLLAAALFAGELLQHDSPILRRQGSQQRRQHVVVMQEVSEGPNA